MIFFFSDFFFILFRLALFQSRLPRVRLNRTGGPRALSPSLQGGRGGRGTLPSPGTARRTPPRCRWLCGHGLLPSRATPPAAGRRSARGRGTPMDTRPLGGSRSCEPPGVTPPHGSHCGCHLRPRGASPPAAKWQHPRGALGVPDGTGSPLRCSAGSGVGARPTAAPPPPVLHPLRVSPSTACAPPGAGFPPSARMEQLFGSAPRPPRRLPGARGRAGSSPASAVGGGQGTPPHDCPPRSVRGWHRGRGCAGLWLVLLFFIHIQKKTTEKNPSAPKRRGWEMNQRGAQPLLALNPGLSPPPGGLTPGVVAPGRRLCPRRALSMDLFQPRLFSPRGPGGRSAL